MGRQNGLRKRLIDVKYVRRVMVAVAIGGSIIVMEPMKVHALIAMDMVILAGIVQNSMD